MPTKRKKRMALVIALLVSFTIGSVALLSIITRGPQRDAIQTELPVHETEVLLSVEPLIFRAAQQGGTIYFVYTRTTRESLGVEGILDAFAEHQREFEPTPGENEYEELYEAVFDLWQRTTSTIQTLTVNRVELDGTLTTVLDLCNETHGWTAETLWYRRLLGFWLSEEGHLRFLAQESEEDMTRLFYTELDPAGDILFHHELAIEDWHIPERFALTEEGDFIVQLRRSPRQGYLYFFDQDGAFRTALAVGDGDLIRTNDGDFVFASDVVTSVNVAEGTLGEVISDIGLPRNVIVYDADPDAPFELYFRRGSQFYGFCVHTGEQTEIFNWYGAGFEAPFDGSVLFLPDGRIAVFHRGR